MSLLLSIVVTACTTFDNKVITCTTVIRSGYETIYSQEQCSEEAEWRKNQMVRIFEENPQLKVFQSSGLCLSSAVVPQMVKEFKQAAKRLDYDHIIKQSKVGDE